MKQYRADLDIELIVTAVNAYEAIKDIKAILIKEQIDVPALIKVTEQITPQHFDRDASRTDIEKIMDAQAYELYLKLYVNNEHYARLFKLSDQKNHLIKVKTVNQFQIKKAGADLGNYFFTYASKKEVKQNIESDFKITFFQEFYIADEYTKILIRDNVIQKELVIQTPFITSIQKIKKLTKYE